MTDSVADRAIDQLFDVAVVLGDLMNSRLGRSGLTPQRAEVLWVLQEQGVLTQRELSQILECTPRNVTGLIDALTTAGLVERRPHPSDRRAVQVNLSESGRALLASWNADRRDGTARVMDGITRAELATFTDVLGRIVANLRGAYSSD